MCFMRLPVLACLVGLFSAGIAHADPIVVTTGSVVTSPVETFAEFSLRGGGDSRVDGQWPGLSLACSPCLAGGMASPAGRFLYDNVPFVWGDPFASGSATIGGVTYPSLFFSGELTFSGDPFVLPEIVGSDQILVFSQPFTFAATISGYDRLLEGPFELAPLFTTAWLGAGTADVRFHGISFEGRSIYTYLGTTYEFAEPVPEPATLLLCATGIAVLIRRRHASGRAQG